MIQLSLFDGTKLFNITQPIRLIELFAGYGSQALALKYLGVPFEHWRISEWAIKSIQAYKDMHFTDDHTDYSKALTVEQIKSWLFGKISADYNTPMTKQQISRLSDNQLRTIYNNMQSTHNIGSITQIDADDLQITDTDEYCYIMTYSFPCQDLSTAGQQKGMVKGSGTRSGLLWEVERLLNEMLEKPQILLMENVPQVVGSTGIKDFAQWIAFLEQLGYKNYWQLMNAKDYGIPQNRNRCFMVSVLGDYYYSFPKAQTLNVLLKDLLEDNVDEKYYLSDKTVEMFIDHTRKQQEKGNGFRFEPTDGNNIAATITTKAGSRPDDNYIKECCRIADGVLLNKTEKFQNGLLFNLSRTIDTNGKNGVVEWIKPKCELVGMLAGGKWDKMHDNNRRVYNINAIAPTLCTCGGGNTEPKILVSEATKKGYDVAKIGDSINLAFPQSQTRRGRIGHSIAHTITATNMEQAVIAPNYRFFEQALETVRENDCEYGDTIDAFNKRVNKDGISPTITTRPDGFKTAILPITQDYRIRKLTPKECFRLMGVKDEDFEKVSKKQSNSSLYHLAGDSIVVDVLMAIFKQIL